MKAIYGVLGLLLAQAAFAGQVMDVCNVLASHFDQVNATTCTQFASAHRNFDSAAVDVCLSIANKYDGANAAACVNAIADKTYYNNGTGPCKTLADQYAGLLAVACLSKGGVVEEPHRDGCMSVLDIRTTLQSSLYQLDHDYEAGRAALDLLEERLQQCH